MSTPIKPDTMYTYGYIEGGFNVTGVSGLVPTPEFTAYREAIIQLRGNGAHLVKRMRRGDVTDDDPGFSEVELHPEFDVLRSGGPLGTTILEHRPNQENVLPPKLEQFTDEQLAALAGNSAIRLVQLHELRDLELKLSQSNPDYRVAIPYPD